MRPGVFRRRRVVYGRECGGEACGRLPASRGAAARSESDGRGRVAADKGAKGGLRCGRGRRRGGAGAPPPLRIGASPSSGDVSARTAAGGRRATVKAGRGRDGTATVIRRLRGTGRAGRARAGEAVAWGGSGERNRASRAPVEAAAGRRTRRGKGSSDRRRGTRSRETAAAGGVALPWPRPPSAAGRGSRDPLSWGNGNQRYTGAAVI